MSSTGAEWDSDSAGERASARAPVTPRVYAPHTGEPLPFTDCIRRLIDRKVKGIVCLHGPPGSGKTTALRHLQAVLPVEICPRVVDGPFNPAESDPATTLTIFTDHASPNDSAPSFQMATWSRDDCIEYLLAVHPKKCASVMKRIQALPNASMLDGRPELWRILLDAFAADESMNEIAVALRLALSPLLTLHGGPIGLFCLEALSHGHDLSDYPKLGLPTAAGRLVRHRPVQLVLAADRIVEQLCERRGFNEFESVLLADLIEEAARLSQFWPSAVEQLHFLAHRQHGASQAMAISTLVAGDPTWRPTFRLLRLAGASLPGVLWSRVDLSKADLSSSRFSNADLRYARLRFTKADSANFSNANLRFASLSKASARGANFRGADLSYARAKQFKAVSTTFDGAMLDAALFGRAEFQKCDLKGSRFVGTDLTRAVVKECPLEGADFSDAVLRGASFDDCDLAAATFDRAIFRGSNLRKCNLAGMRLNNIDFGQASLIGSDLTGTVMQRANFERANLCNTGLAEIDWEGANLRHADLRYSSFHLGSTRSGLVGSTIASEGTRTGFYTDDYDDQTYRAPEEIRKANLRGVDLRGANIDGVDFYLVDLRDAIYTDVQREQFVACRAILKDHDD